MKKCKGILWNKRFLRLPRYFYLTKCSSLPHETMKICEMISMKNAMSAPPRSVFPQTKKGTSIFVAAVSSFQKRFQATFFSGKKFFWSSAYRGHLNFVVVLLPNNMCIHNLTFPYTRETFFTIPISVHFCGRIFAF